MNEPLTPWPDRQEGEARFLRSMQEGHTQLFLKCKNCGLEFIILTWRTGPDLLAAFGIYEKPETLPDDTAVVDPFNEPVEVPEGHPLIKAPTATQVVCPECAIRGKTIVIDLRIAPGPIVSAGWPDGTPPSPNQGWL